VIVDRELITGQNPRSESEVRSSDRREAHRDAGCSQGKSSL